MFGLIGDVPYSEAEVVALEGVIDEMNRFPLGFIAHVGDITSGRGPCDDAWMEARKRQFARWRAPLVLLPGDNEWTDCHRTGMDPLERLAKWRSLFCVDAPPLVIERQPGHCENARWEHAGVTFVALNIAGSNNNLGRNPQMDAEHAKRMAAVFAWLDESVAKRGPEGLVILIHANPDFEHRNRRRAGVRDGYEDFRKKLDSLPKPVVLVHGDTHMAQDNEPLPGVRRIEVWGSPIVRWTRGISAGGKFWFD